MKHNKKSINENSQKILVRNDILYVLYAILANPCCNAYNIMKITKIPQTGVYRHIKKLLEQKMIKIHSFHNSTDRRISYTYEANIDKLQLTITKDKFEFIKKKD